MPGAPVQYWYRKGLGYDVLSSTQRDVDGKQNIVRFPFRATAMRLPSKWEDLSFEEMGRQALALGYGLTPSETISETFLFGRYLYCVG